MTEEYELSTHDRHELNYDQVALGRLPVSVIEDTAIKTLSNSISLPKRVMEGHSGLQKITSN
jgi:hypothetical protein